MGMHYHLQCSFSYLTVCVVVQQHHAVNGDSEDHVTQNDEHHDCARLFEVVPRSRRKRSQSMYQSAGLRSFADDSLTGHHRASGPEEVVGCGPEVTFDAGGERRQCVRV